MGSSRLARHKAQLLGAVGAVNREPLSERVYQTLRGAILSGGVKLGDHLSETGVARQMEVSPTPVREALRRLAAEGLVVISSYKGAVVQEFADQQIIEIYQCREALKGVASRLAAQNIDTDGIEALKKALNRAIQAKHPLKLSETNSIFHNIIVSYARNSRLQSLFGLFNDVIMRDRNVIAYSAERPRADPR